MKAAKRIRIFHVAPKSGLHFVPFKGLYTSCRVSRGGSPTVLLPESQATASRSKILPMAISGALGSVPWSRPNLFDPGMSSYAVEPVWWVTTFFRRILSQHSARMAERRNEVSRPAPNSGTSCSLDPPAQGSGRLCLYGSSMYGPSILSCRRWESRLAWR